MVVSQHIDGDCAQHWDSCAACHIVCASDTINSTTRTYPCMSSSIYILLEATEVTHADMSRGMLARVPGCPGSSTQMTPGLLGSSLKEKPASPR